jgi:enolase
MDVQAAVRAVAGPINDALEGIDVLDQEAVDRRLIELDGTPEKAKLGGNATIAVSMAAAHAAAAAEGVPLWRWLGGDAVDMLPLPEIQIFGGGAHAAGRLDIQDFMWPAPARQASRRRWNGRRRFIARPAV